MSQLRKKYSSIDTKTHTWHAVYTAKDRGYYTNPIKAVVADITGYTLNSNECLCTYFDKSYCLCMQSNGNLVLYKRGKREAYDYPYRPPYELDIVTGACWGWTNSNSYQFTSSSTSVKITKDGRTCWSPPELFGNSGRLFMDEKGLYWGFERSNDRSYKPWEYAYKQTLYLFEFQSLTIYLHHSYSCQAYHITSVMHQRRNSIFQIQANVNNQLNQLPFINQQTIAGNGKLARYISLHITKVRYELFGYYFIFCTPLFCFHQ
eukprot:TRINITY_DN0_c0_g1_i2.p2 TRINITY_DN0_c0_g1~~TRINITY_DN0_c0_g1_i2.p2  ORF type:complete len:262 (-),score=-15.74 TRINITY_DN0_c0_g1_i2:116-901(-)